MTLLKFFVTFFNRAKIDYALQNVRNQKEMKEGGWIVEVDLDNMMDNKNFANCEGRGTFWGYKKGSGLVFVQATFKGSGKGTLEFGSCYKRMGVTRVYLNDKEIAQTYRDDQSATKTFEFKTPCTEQRNPELVCYQHFTIFP